MKYITAHPGSRDYYILSAALYRLNKLKVLYTDIYLKKHSNYILKKMAENRYSNFLPDQLVKCYNTKFLLFQLYNKTWKHKNKFDDWIRLGKFFSSCVLNDLKNEHETNLNIWGFTCAHLELIQYAKENNIPTTFTQVDGGVGYYIKALQIWEKYPYAENKPIQPTSLFLDRIEEEMRLTDKVVVNSQYISSMLKIHYPFLTQRKIEVLPLSFEKPAISANLSLGSEKYYQHDWIVLWVGNINLMKGFMSFYETAKNLSGKGFKFIAAGNNNLSNEFYLTAKKNIQFAGKLSKSDLFDLYQRSHVFIFPTLCDSFGMVQLEAMSFGLPVIATKNCADIVIDNENGFQIKEDSSNDIIEKLLLLKKDRNQYSYISENATQTASKFSLNSYMRSLQTCINN